VASENELKFAKALLISPVVAKSVGRPVRLVQSGVAAATAAATSESVAMLAVALSTAASTAVVVAKLVGKSTDDELIISLELSSSANLLARDFHPACPRIGILISPVRR
jgi:hypothetical protein